MTLTLRVTILMLLSSIVFCKEEKFTESNVTIKAMSKACEDVGGKVSHVELSGSDNVGYYIKVHCSTKGKDDIKKKKGDKKNGQRTSTRLL